MYLPEAQQSILDLLRCEMRELRAVARLELSEDETEVRETRY